MKFECGDLERALANPDLMPEAREHLRDCAECRKEYRLWTGITSAAKELHREWESPELWTGIRKRIEAEREIPKRKRTEWKLWAFATAAAMVFMLALVRLPKLIPAYLAKIQMHGASARLAGDDFLSDSALQEAEKKDTAYQRSIDALSRQAQPKLENHISLPILLSYQEKLLMLDSAILETRSNLAQNRFNTRLQKELSDLYRDKQHTLQEILSSGERN